MASKPVNLSQHAVSELRQLGITVVVRALNQHTDPEQQPETAHQVGDRLWGREVVSARKKDDTRWYYLADGKEPNRFWLPNYQMPAAACRFELEVRSEDLEYIGGRWVASTQVAVAGPKIYAVDFDLIRLANMRTKHFAIFPARMLDFATDPTLRRSVFVRQHEHFKHLEWILPLSKREVRWWLREVRFTQAPSIIVGGAEMSVGKEVAP